MVQVYSLSSSSRTVQLYSRSRLLLLPLINLLSIFPPARRPRERRRGAADPGLGAPQRGSSAPNPGTCTITPARSPPLPPAGPAPLPSPPPGPPPPPPAQSKHRALAPRRPSVGAQLVGRGLGRRGPNGGQRGGTEWQEAQPIEIVGWNDGQVREAITGKQSERAEPDQPSSVPNEGLFSLQFLPMLFPLPRARCGHSAGPTSAVGKTSGLCFRGQVLHSATPRFPPSRESGRCETTIPAPAECTHLPLQTWRLPQPAIPRLPDEPLCPRPFIWGNMHILQYFTGAT